MKRTIKSEKLRGFRWMEKTKFAPMSAHEAVIVLGLSTPLMHGFEMDDPTAAGKRDHNVEYLIHGGKVWRTVWMDRSGNYAKRGKKSYGVKELKGAPVSEFV